MLYYSKILATLTTFASAILAITSPSRNNSRDISAPGLFAFITPSTSLVWQPCSDGFFCALLLAPLDYDNKGLGHVTIPLLKLSAIQTPYKGMVLTNPGGPGDSAIDFLLDASTFISGPIGANYDIVAWEPRGIGYSKPLAICSTTTPQMQLNKRTLYQPYGPRLTEKLYTDEYNYMKDLGTACQTSIGGSNQIGRYMHTTVVARDALRIVDAYAASSYSTGTPNKSLMNYWGFSYGTVIGQTFASMFPSRVGRFVLDGVIDADDYRSNTGSRNLQLTDTAFSTFFVYCNKAGATSCPYYTGSTSKHIFNRFEGTILRLDSKTAFRSNWANATAVHLGLLALKKLAFGAIYAPISIFPQLAEALLYFEQIVQDISVADIQNLEATTGTQLNLHPTSSSPQWAPAIYCTDGGNGLYGKTLAQLKPKISALENHSYIGGEIWATAGLACAGWSIPGKGIFTGIHGGDTKTPILFVSNTRDPVAPILNGIRALKRFQKSQLLAIDGTGHMSLAVENKCAFTKINAYFQSGTLPGANFLCPLEAGPWGVTLSGLVLDSGPAGLLHDILRGLKRILQTQEES